MKTATVLSRVNGAEPERLRELAESEEAREQAEIDLHNLRDKLKELADER